MNTETETKETDAYQLKLLKERERQAKIRRAQGKIPQSERTKTAELQAIANLVGKSLMTIRRRDKAGSLNEYLASLGYDEKKCRVLINHMN